MGHILSKKLGQAPDVPPQANIDETASTSKTKSNLMENPKPPSVTGTAEVVPNTNEPEDSSILNSLPERDCKIVQHNWNNDFGVLYDVGTDIYSEIFRLDPTVKTLFKALDNYDLEKDPKALRQCAMFNKQALRFVQTISMTVQNCGHLDSIENYLKSIGRRHVQYKRDGFDPKYWNIFETAITNVMSARAEEDSKLNEEQKKILADSYKKLARHIIAVMTVGFHEEAENT